MSPQFEQRYKYIVFEPVDSVRSQLKSIVKSPWYDIAINLSGKVFEDNTFKLYSKMGMGIKVFGMVQEVAMISGRLEPNLQQTNIQIEVKPTQLVLLAFYVILFIFLIKLLGLFIWNTQQDWAIVIASFLVLIFIRSLIHFSMGQLKNRFERTMLLHPEE
jgi:hypothetical protein